MTIDPKYLLSLFVLIVMGWFAGGIIFNLRRGDTVLRWMQKGLPKIGERTTFRWLGTSVAEMVITKPRRPFNRLVVLLALAPRDVPWFWLLTYLQGRRDTLIFRGQLPDAPLIDLELVNPSVWTGRTALREASARGWENQPFQDMQLLAPKGLSNLATRTVERLLPKTAALSPKVYRLSLRKEQPHLEVHLPFPDTHSAASDYFEAIRNLAQAAGERFPE